MANNYDDYEYDDESYNKGGNNNSNILNKIGILLLIIIAIVIIVVLINGCSKREKTPTDVDPGPDSPEVLVDYDSALLNAGKRYFETNRNEYPTSVGDCVQVTLQELITRGYITSEELKNCNSINTYVRVCKLENSTLQYTPWFSCNDKQSNDEYDESKEGTLNNIYADSTYVDFMYLPQVLQNGTEQLGKVEEVWKDDISYVNYKTLATTTYYRYKDKLFRWNVVSKLYYTTHGEKTEAKDVNEYYTSAPSGKYVYSDNKTTEAYKWYTTTSKKEYALASNGAKAFSTKAIGDYNLHEGGVIVTYYKVRTASGSRTPTHYYACATSSTSPYLIFQTTSCPSAHNPEYKVQRFDFYSCAEPGSSSDTIYGNQVKSTDSCVTYGAWSDPIKEDVASGRTCPAGSTTDTCVKTSATFYNWYKLVDGGDRTYYPSGASSASGERVYYTSAPVSGAIKDVASKATAYKWYAETSTVTSNYTAIAPGGYVSATKTSDSKWTDWSKWSKSNPKTSDGRERQIESKVKIKLQEIKGSTSTDWKDLSLEYVTKDQMIKAFQNTGYKVNTLDDINNNGEIRYQVKMFVRNKKEINQL